ncbi:MupG family TIM beta-alpha barrel fold protein [Mycoplasmopsis ciconiae]|uniref:MupG family TIM beta-alpha barrel fold protein n=1 Tax=Mycoplasmopsis ciconiae TaxID=561067 RepID=A0ABU7MLB2_9BACT|nr:MupG family TIM beta-alpha barrel fold protein [Mycoplasmopsis ciconiae]
MLGISIYPEKQDKKEIFRYIDKASEYKFKRIFSCLLSVTDTKENLIKNFSEINEYAHKKGMFVILDVNPRVFDTFGASYDDLSFFKELKADGIRLDMGFDGKKEADMTFNTQNLLVEINISNDNKYLDNIISYHPKKDFLIASHNFYPQKYTGLSLEFFNKITLKFKQNHIKTAAFVTSEIAKVGPWDLSHGLCTLEISRNLPIKTQVKHLYATKLIDDIIIGNSFASDIELKQMSQVDPDIITFEVKTIEDFENNQVIKDILFNEKHFRRGDTNDFFVRSTQSRVKYKNESFLPQNTPKKLKRGDVVICNDNYKQYKGELQIILKDTDNDDLGKNVVAKIKEHEIFLLDYLPALGRFKFEK